MENFEDIIQQTRDKYRLTQQPSNEENLLNTLYADTLAPFAIGLGNMANDTAIGGTGWLLGNIGRVVEAISPFSGMDKEHKKEREILDSVALISGDWSILDNVDERLPLYRDSWITSAAKGTLGLHNYVSDALDNYEKQVIGENPNWWQELLKGSGSSFGYMMIGNLGARLAASLANAAPLTSLVVGGFTQGAGESLSEAGGFLADAYKNGQYDNGAIGVANKSFGTNFLLNTLLDTTVGRFNPKVNAIENPFKHWLASTGAEVVNEILQEPSQQVIEKAAQNTLNGNGGFMSNLGESLKEWPQTFMELAPTVAGSTLLTQILLGLGGLSTGAGRRRIALRSLENNPATTINNKTGKLGAKTDSSRLDALQSEWLDNLKSKRDNLQSQVDDIIYQPYPEDFDSQIETSRKLDDLTSQLRKINETLKEYKARLSPEEIDLFPDEQSETPETPPTSPAQDEQFSTPNETDIEDRITPPKVDLLPGDQQDTVQDNTPNDEDLPPLTGLRTPTTEQTQKVLGQESQPANETTLLPPVTGLRTNTTEDTAQEQQFDEKAPSDNDVVNMWSRILDRNADNAENYSQAVIKRSKPQISHDGNVVGNIDIRGHSKTQSFDVATVESQDTDRLTRKRGPRKLEIRTKSGKVIAEFHPNTNIFIPVGDTIRKFSHKARQNFESSFNSSKNDFLNAAGWLDVDGNILPDGNEGFRARWDARIEREGNNNSFYLSEAQPEDFDDVQAPTTENISAPQTVENQAQGQDDERFSPQRFGEITAPQIERPQVSTPTPKTKKSRISNLLGNLGQRISQSLGNSETYNQSMTAENNGEMQELTVETQEFSDKHPRHKKIFGRFLEIKDKFGRIVARYSPQTGKFQMAKEFANDNELEDNIRDELDRNYQGYLYEGGFLDENGKLIDDGNKDARREYYKNRERKRSKEQSAKKESSEKKQAPKKKSLYERLKNKVTDKVEYVVGAARYGHAYRKHKLKSAVDYALEKILSRFDDEQTKKLITDIEEKLRDLEYEDKEGKKHKYFSEHFDNSESYIKPVARLLAYQARFFSSYYGISPEQYLSERGFNIRYSHDYGDTFIRDKNGKITGQNRGNAEYIFQPRDKQGNIISEASNIITLLQTSNPTTLIHELGHFFLSNFRDLTRTGRLKGVAKQDWNTLIKWLGVEDLDFTQINFVGEDKKRWTDAQEKFAVGFEKYITTGKAPSMKLRRAFESLKRWMKSIYAAVRGIKYRGTNGLDHEFELSPEIEAVFGRIFTDVNKSGVVLGSQGDLHGEGESYNQPLNNDVELDRQVNVVSIAETMPNVPFYQRIKAFNKSMQNEIISRFADGQVVNEHTGLTITLSKQGLNHILDTARANDNIAGEVIFQSVPSLDILAREAYRVETHHDRKPSATKIEGQLGNLKRVHRFLVPVEFNGDTHILKLTAKEYETGKAEIDEVSLYDMKYAKKLSSHPSQNSPNLIGRATETLGSPDMVSVRDMIKDVNDAEGNPYFSEGNSETYN